MAESQEDLEDQPNIKEELSWCTVREGEHISSPINIKKICLFKICLVKNTVWYGREKLF